MLSFIIPVYKPDLQIFRKCLKSLKVQSLEEWEAIFVLDGEDIPAEAEITAVLPKGKYKIITIPHSGVQKARNLGAKSAKYKYWIFWDCDCIIECHSAKAWIDIFEKRPEVGFIYSGYKFLEEKGAILSQPFDPFTLKIRNYITTCSPLRKTLYPGWDESLKSLQDWDFWLSVVEKGGKGFFMEGYSFSTASPTEDSISGEGCTDENWLDRMDAVTKKHKIKHNDVCVSSIEDRLEGIRFAKLIGADYYDVPNDKPNRYKTIVQLGFSFTMNTKTHSHVFSKKSQKKILFWTSQNITEINTSVSLKALYHYSNSINKICTQYCEDLESQSVLKRAGFKVEVMPLPIVNTDEIEAYPKEPKFLVDAVGHYEELMGIVERSIPDIKLENVNGRNNLKDYIGLISLTSDHVLDSTIKRALLTGKIVISNVKQPFCGFIDDYEVVDKFIPEMVDRIRKASLKKDNIPAVNYYKRVYSTKKILEVINEG